MLARIDRPVRPAVAVSGENRAAGSTRKTDRRSCILSSRESKSMLLNVGPSHPAMHGVIRLVLLALLPAIREPRSRQRPEGEAALRMSRHVAQPGSAGL